MPYGPPSALHLRTDYRCEGGRDATFHPPGHSPRGFNPSAPLFLSPTRQPDPYGDSGQCLPPSSGPFEPEYTAVQSYNPGFDAPPPPSYQEFLLRQQQQPVPTARLLVAGEPSSQQQEEEQNRHLQQQDCPSPHLLTKHLSGDRVMYYRPPWDPRLSANGPALMSPQGGGVILPPPPYQGPKTPKKQQQQQQIPAVQAVSPAVQNPDFAGIPGVNLKKANVDLTVYVNSLVPFKHPQFANIDGFVERCLACIVRKIRSNLPTLSTLLRVVRHRPGDPDPGCVLVPRTKDSRITVARPAAAGVATASSPGGAALPQPQSGGGKKIHPHLALVQIFRHPNAQNPGQLLPSPLCASPYAASQCAAGDEGGLLCISPLHYVLGDNPSRSPGAARQSASKHHNVSRASLKAAAAPTKEREGCLFVRIDSHKNLTGCTALLIFCILFFI